MVPPGQDRVVEGLTKCWLRGCSPAGAVKDGAWATHDAILEMLNLHEAGRQSLGHGGNETAGSAGGGGSSSPSASGRSSAGGGGAKAGSSGAGEGSVSA